MIFNGDADDQDICTLADKFVKTDDTDFPLKEKATYANMAVREILSWIISVYGGWIMDDYNNTTNLPSATTDINADQTNYTLPEIIDLMGLSFKNQGSVSWTKLKPITLEQIEDMGYAEPEFMRTSGTPIYYRPIGNVIKLYPAANFTQSGSLQAEFSRDIVPFTSTSTSVSPGFMITFHEAVSIFMALQYASINSLDVETALQKRWDGNEEVTKIEGGYKKRIKNHYQARYREMFPTKIAHRRDVVQEYI